MKPSPMKHALQAAVVTTVILIAMAQAAQAKTCSELGDDLRSMQKAQASLLESMVRKNDSMASTLDQYANNLQNQRTVRKSDVISLRKSGQAFRDHESREEKLVGRFNKKTDELLTLVEECLKTKSIAAQ